MSSVVASPLDKDRRSSNGIRGFSHVDGFLMMEHPGWIEVGGGHARLMQPEGGDERIVELFVAEGERVTSTGEAEAHEFLVSDRLVKRLPVTLGRALGSLGTVRRFRNVSLWDALVTAIMRQVIRAPQSRDMYRRFCHSFGSQAQLQLGSSVYWLTPSPSLVLDLTDKQFHDARMAFKAPALRSAARAFLDRGDEWRAMPAGALVEELRLVRGIGPWTARAAVADWTNDWSFYPYDDLAVRTWAARAAPSCRWPTDERDFAMTWERLGRDKVGDLTLLTLAWGSKRGVIG